jgi:hypothetical protein
MLEKLALLKMALCRASAVTIDSAVWPSVVFELEMTCPDSHLRT